LENLELGDFEISEPFGAVSGFGLLPPFGFATDITSLLDGVQQFQNPATNMSSLWDVISVAEKAIRRMRPVRDEILVEE
jgi:hypothetical protein